MSVLCCAASRYHCSEPWPLSKQRASPGDKQLLSLRPRHRTNSLSHYSLCFTHLSKRNKLKKGERQDYAQQWPSSWRSVTRWCAGSNHISRVPSLRPTSRRVEARRMKTAKKTVPVLSSVEDIPLKSPSDKYKFQQARSRKAVECDMMDGRIEKIPVLKTTQWVRSFLMANRISKNVLFIILHYAPDWSWRPRGTLRIWLFSQLCRHSLRSLVQQRWLLQGAPITRHNAVRDVLFSAAQSAALAMLFQTPCADILLPTWHGGRPAALDVHIISPPRYMKPLLLPRPVVTLNLTCYN